MKSRNPDFDVFCLTAPQELIIGIWKLCEHFAERNDWRSRAPNIDGFNAKRISFTEEQRTETIEKKRMKFWIILCPNVSQTIGKLTEWN